MKKIYCALFGNCIKFKSPNIFLKKQYFFLLFAVNVGMGIKKYERTNNQLNH